MIIRIPPQLAYQMMLKLQRMNEELLRIDIAYVLAAGDERGMSEGWPHHPVDPIWLAASCHESNKPIEEPR